MISLSDVQNNTTLHEAVRLSDVERFIWAAWLFLIFSSSLIGDTIVLLASVKYGAFKIQVVIVTFIQHMAVCDLLISLVCILPHSISLVTKSWVFGSALCYLACYVQYYGDTTSN